MSEPGDEDQNGPAPASGGKGARPKAASPGEDREARLAAALRANLRRRKTAARKPAPNEGG